MTALQACTLQSVPRQLLIHLLMYMISMYYYFQIHLLLNVEKYISKVPARTWGVPDSRSGMEEQSSSDFFTIIDFPQLLIFLYRLNKATVAHHQQLQVR